MTNTITSLKSVLTAGGHTASARTRATATLVVGLSTRRKPRRLANSNVRPSGNWPVENVSWDELQRAGGFLDQINAMHMPVRLKTCPRTDGPIEEAAPNARCAADVFTTGPSIAPFRNDTKSIARFTTAASGFGSCCHALRLLTSIGR